MTLERKKDFLINILFAATVIGITVVVAKFMFAYLLPFVIGVCVAFAVQRPSAAVSRKFHIKKQACAVFFTVAVCLLFFVICALLIWALGSKLIDLLTRLPGYFSGFEKSIDAFRESMANNMRALDSEQREAVYGAFSRTAGAFVSSVTGILSSFATGLIKGLPAFLVSSVVTVVASCYIAKDFDKLKKFAFGMMSKNLSKRISEIKSIFTENASKFLKGYLIIALITFAELTVALLILNVKNPVVKALAVAVVDFLPVLGVGTVLIPWAALELLGCNWFLGMGLTVTYIIITLVHNFIEPKIIGEQIGINPVFTLISMFVGLKIAGLAGMILTPLSLTVVFGYFRKTVLSDKER
ncbi:MAG: sporulation integral membrane protein YtvI [Clostridia bacterium]|nr:sporulation integral membrane protein YtvI [Clostridia bacterium]